MEESATDDRPPGDSRKQRDAEAVMLAALSQRLGVKLSSRRIPVAGAHVMVDGAAEDLTVICEAWARQGSAKPAQVSKVLKDAFKLAFLRRALPTAPRAILLFSDEAAAAKFRLGWAAAALASFEIEIAVVEIPDEIRAAIVAAQSRQHR